MDQVKKLDGEAQARAAQIDAMVRMTHAVAEAIRSLRQVPSGVLYAHLMGQISLKTYDAIIDTLLKAKVIRREGHLITWIGR